MITVNGRAYPLWSQFVEGKDKWIGGKLQNRGDLMDRRLGLTNGDWEETKITDIELRANGEDSAYFKICRKDFSCGGDTAHVGIIGGENGWLTFSGYGGHEFRIKQVGE